MTSEKIKITFIDYLKYFIVRLFYSIPTLVIASLFLTLGLSVFIEQENSLIVETSINFFLIIGCYIFFYIYYSIKLAQSYQSSFKIEYKDSNNLKFLFDNTTIEFDLNNNNNRKRNILKKSSSLYILQLEKSPSRVFIIPKKKLSLEFIDLFEQKIKGNNTKIKN
jgi:hypothetical protein